MAKVACKPGSNTFQVVFKPTVQLERWGDGDNTTMPYSVLRGPLLFSLPIEGNYTVTAHHFGTDTMMNDYEVRPITEWRYALDVGASSWKVQQSGYTDGSAPFNHSGWPITLSATVRELDSWNMSVGSASPPPASPVCRTQGSCGDPKEVTLVPHGGTDLRIGEFPLA